MCEEKKSYDLKINIQKDFNHILGYAFPLCIALSEENLLGWYYENYIGIYGYIYNDVEIVADISDALTYEHIETRLMSNMFLDIKLAKLIKNIIKDLEERIANKYYIVVFLDEYYIDDRYFTNRNHFVHEFLIYGYDKNRKIFKAVAFDKSMSFTSIEIDYDQFSKAYNEGIRYSKLRNNPDIDCRYLMYFQIYNHKMKYKFSIKNFYEKLYRYYTCKFNSNEIYFAKEIYFRKLNYLNKLDNLDSLKYGIDTYDIFIDYLKKLIDILKSSPENFINYLDDRYKLFHLFYQHKMGLYKRFMYIKNNFEVSNELAISLDNYKNIYIALNNIRMGCLKLTAKIQLYIDHNFSNDDIIKYVKSKVNNLIKVLSTLKNEEKDQINKILILLDKELLNV